MTRRNSAPFKPKAAMTRTTTGTWQHQLPLTVSDRVYEAVRDRILTGHYARGEFIREHDVAKGMGTSHTPVREALGRLATEGLLERMPHRGFCVPEQATVDFIELMPVLSWLELLAAKLSLPHFTKKDVDRLIDINQKLVQMLDNEDTIEVIRWNSKFHSAIWSKCGNDRLVKVLGELDREMVRPEFIEYARLWHRDRMIKNHAEIINFIRELRFDRVLQTLEWDRLATLTLPHEARHGKTPASSADAALKEAVPLHFNEVIESLRSSTTPSVRRGQTKSPRRRRT